METTKPGPRLWYIVPNDVQHVGKTRRKGGNMLLSPSHPNPKAQHCAAGGVGAWQFRRRCLYQHLRYQFLCRLSLSGRSLRVTGGRKPTRVSIWEAPPNRLR